MFYVGQTALLGCCSQGGATKHKVTSLHTQLPLASVLTAEMDVKNGKCPDIQQKQIAYLEVIFLKRSQIDPWPHGYHHVSDLSFFVTIHCFQVA